MARRHAIQLVGITALAAIGLIVTFVAGNAPVLGLDLQGGVSVRLEATEPADDDLLDQAVEIIRNRVDGLGVAEPEISRVSNGVLVSLPGVEDQDRALALVGQTAEMRFRPVCAVLPAGETPGSTTTTEPGDGDSTTTTAPESTSTTEAGSEAPETTVARFRQPTTTEPPETTTTTTADDGGPTTTTADDGGTTTTTTPPEDDGPPDCLDALAGTVTPITDDSGVTPAEQDEADDFVILPGRDEEGVHYLLGPAGLTGDAVDTARAIIPQFEWLVQLDLHDEGAEAWDELTIQCFGGGSATCTQGRVAITLDGEVLIAPTPQQPGGYGGGATITGQFTQGEAEDLALAIRYGALPVPLEPQGTEIVSASIGEDALDAGIVAGIIGVVLLAAFMIAYYRILGLVALGSLAVSSAILWTIIAYLGETNGLALTLAGVTGLIVSVGVAVDSNIVYYEHLKEDIKDGRNPRSSVDRAFPAAFSTIVKADMATLIGAFLLYVLTVGAVRGFAFYLGLATLLDLVGTYFFMGPAVRLLARRDAFRTHPTWFGLPRTAWEGR